MLEEENIPDRVFRLNRIFNARFGAQSVVTVKELVETLPIGRSQLFKDFKMLTDLGAPLVHDKKLNGHRYTAPFLIADRILFTADELANLAIGISWVSKIDYLEGFKQMPGTFRKIQKAVKKWSADEAPGKAIFFDPMPEYKGGKYLAFLVQAIEHEWQITFVYQAFHGAPAKTVVFDPYFLRHYDRRWYVGGFSHDPSELFVRTFPLERIVGAPEKLGHFLKKQPDYNPENYWKNIFGITVPRGGEVEEVDLQFTMLQARYFETTPFFTPFEVLERTADFTTIRLRLIPNFDLKQKLASLGSGVKVLRPAWFAAEVMEYLQLALSRYEKET